MTNLRMTQAVLRNVGDVAYRHPTTGVSIVWISHVTSAEARASTPAASTRMRRLSHVSYILVLLQPQLALRRAKEEKEEEEKKRVELEGGIASHV